MAFLEWFRGLIGEGGREAAAGYNRKRKQAAWVRSFPGDEDRVMGRRARTAIQLEARDLDRNHGLLFGVCNRIASYSVPRLLPTFETPSKDWNAEAKEWFDTWNRSADVRGLDPFSRLVWTAVRSSLLDGDGGFLRLADGRVQPIESELIRAPDGVESRENVRNGVELDAYGRPVAFWIAPRKPGNGFPDGERARRVLARDFVFFRHAYRFDAVRGVAPVAAILTDLSDEKDLHESYLRKARHDSKQAGVVHTEDGQIPSNLDFRRPGADEESESGEEEDATPATYEDEDLQLWWLRPNEKVTPLIPTTPSTSIVQYEEHLVRMMSAALGIPAEFWTLDLRGLSWSTANATVKLAGDAFRDMNRWAVHQIVRPVLEWRLLMAIRDGELSPAPTEKRRNGLEVSTYNKFRLRPPEYLWANKRERLESAKLEQQMGMPAVESLANDDGLTVDEAVEKRKALLRTVVKAQRELEAELGVPISLSMFLDAQTSGITPLPSAGIADGGKKDDEGSGK